MKLFDFLIKISRKLPNCTWLFPIAKLAYYKKKAVDEDFDSYAYLESLHPRNHNSCLRIIPAQYTQELVDLMVVIPVYNTARYLGECLDSVLSQKTQYSFSVVIVNDGSTDGSNDILKAFNNRGG